MILHERIYQRIWPNVIGQNVDQELFLTPDGGTVGVMWDIDGDGGRPTNNNQKPILLIVLGLIMNQDAQHARVLWWTAKKQGYKVGIVLYRTAPGVPVTSNKLTYSGSWPDLKVVIEHVYNSYVFDSKERKNMTHLYAYGCSLGA